MMKRRSYSTASSSKSTRNNLSRIADVRFGASPDLPSILRVRRLADAQRRLCALNKKIFKECLRQIRHRRTHGIVEVQFPRSRLYGN
jgi:hypothetical protein